MDLPSLRHLIHTHAIIDNHAHNILSKRQACAYEKHPFEQIISEAHDDALHNATSTLALHRATPQLAQLYGISPDSTWNQVKAARDEWVQRDYEGLVRACLAGTHSLLLDDLLTAEDVEPYDWHDRFTPGRTRRIVRIETLAAQALASLDLDPASLGGAAQRQNLRNSFVAGFHDRLTQAIHDPAVVGFKSVICYRTGLDVQPIDDDDETRLIDALVQCYAQGAQNGYRVEHKPLNDWVVRTTLREIAAVKATATAADPVPNKPLQLHTGLGDCDISLVLANPAYLQPLVARFSTVDFVLLHSSYPYTREAGYLASVYTNVYLDLGEVFPMVSRDAQEQILRQSLDLVPTSHLLWSTDGHFFPETFYLANIQFREALEIVAVEYVKKADWTVSQAKQAVADILFHNSNRLYDLNETLPPTDTLNNLPSGPRLECFRKANPDIKHVWMQFIDYTATMRVRMFPMAEFAKLARQERRLGICECLQQMIQDDHVAPEGSTTGQFYLVPDLDTLHRNVSIPGSNSASVMTFWRQEKDSSAPLPGCPRTLLLNLATRLSNEHQIDVNFGFEIEVVFLRPVTDKDDPDTITGYKPCVTNHSWSQMTSQTRSMVPLLEEIVDTLAAQGIALQQFHAESALGQFEFILPPGPPLAAVDTLLRARQIITNITEQKGLRATLHPRPIPGHAGSAAHAHISLRKADAPQEPPSRDVEDSFLAGIMEHYEALVPFTLSQDASYDRVQSGLWAGSEWVTWGTQNRESPVRKIEAAHWEMKSLDGLANMYLAMSAYLAAGYIGLQKKLQLHVKDCAHDAATLTDEQRQELGITKQLPKSLDEAMEALRADSDLHEVLGAELVKNYLCVKREEREMLNKMDKETRRRWLIARY
ncbi:hypothetical protein BJX96DRAFT_151688 [Aspergillus floccosus]